MAEDWVPEKHAQRSRLVDQPEIGYYLVKLVKGGPSVPARIGFSDGLWFATINGVPCGLGRKDPLKAAGVQKVYLGLRISEAEYQRRLKLRHIPGHPNARPEKPIDITAIPPIQF